MINHVFDETAYYVLYFQNKCAIFSQDMLLGFVRKFVNGFEKSFTFWIFATVLILFMMKIQPQQPNSGHCKSFVIWWVGEGEERCPMAMHIWHFVQQKLISGAFYVMRHIRSSKPPSPTPECRNSFSKVQQHHQCNWGKITHAIHVTYKYTKQLTNDK